MSIYNMGFRDKSYLMTVVGLPNPRWAVESFSLEEKLRDDWWHVQPGDVVMDVGAGFGSYTLTALAAGASLVLAIEPGKEEFFALCQNLYVNNTPPARCLPLNCAVMDVDLVTGYDPEIRSCAAGPTRVMEHRLGGTVDGLVRGYGLPKLDWLKIDVEGAELHVLTGASKTLSEVKPVVLVECHPESCPGVLEAVGKVMTGHGYRGEHRKGKGVNDNWSLWRPDR